MTDTFERLKAALAERYAIERELGSGGMAMVYLAEDLKHHREVAVKVLRPELAAALGPERFLQEIKVTARLTHPHILPLHDSGEADGFLYYVMPYVEGESLRERLNRETQLPIDETLRITGQVAAALDYAHRHDVIHRDIKPENILLHEGEAIVADFGIALAVSVAGGERLTETGLSLGTPEYMSPEQATGSQELDQRSDIYSLACVVYEMVAGEPPHTGPTVQAIMAKVLTDTPQSLRVIRDPTPTAVDAAVTRALAKVPADRFQTAAEFAKALATAPDTAPLRRWRQPSKLTAIVLAFVAVTVVTGLVTDWTFNPFRAQGSAAAARDGNSIAVLPFANLSGQEDDDYLSEGLADELIGALTKVEALRVASRTSSFSFQNSDMDVRDIARRLGVATVLEGSVRKSPTALRVTARLSDAATGYTLWSQTFIRQPQDIFTVQEEIAQAIVSALEIELAAGTGAPIVQRDVEDLNAYNLYLRGRYFWNKRTQQDLLTAVRHFEEAVARAPNYAQAHAGLADAYAVIGFYDYLPPADAFQNARAAAKKALELDASLAEPHATLGYVALYYDWNWSDSEREFRRAIALKPDYAIAHQWYANHLVTVGRFEAARAAARRARELETLSLIISAVQGWISYYAGDYERAIEELNGTLQLEPDFALAHLWTGQAYAELDKLDEAIEWIERAVDLSGGSDIIVAALAHAHARSGARDTVETLLGSLEAQSEDRYVPAFEIAKVYIALGDTPIALEWLQRAYDRRSHSMVFLKVDPQLAELRSNPQFKRLLTRVGLD